MVIKTRILILFSLLVLCFSGCIHHSFLIDLRETGEVHYTISGDRFDLNDERLQYPDSLYWQFISEEMEIQDENEVWTSIWTASLTDSLHHPVSPPEFQPSFNIIRTNYYLFQQLTFIAEFPSWNVLLNYGDLDEFVPTEEEVFGTSNLPESLLRDEFERQRALGMQMGTIRRYLMQLGTVITEYSESNDIEFDSTVFRQAVSSFREIMVEYLEQFDDDDPVDVSLDWYNDLRDPMVLVAYQATDGDTASLFRIADSLDFRWRTWMDVKDDQVTVDLLIPGTWISATPDTLLGDTLHWDIEGEWLADYPVIILAKSYTLNPVMIVITLIIISVVSVLLFKLRVGNKNGH